MKSVKMKKEELLDIVRKNLNTHIADYQESIEGYKLAVAEVAKNNLKIAKTADLDQFNKFEKFPVKPDSHEKEYQRAIRMLELEVDETVEISEEIFNQLVLDEWHWSSQFNFTKSLYNSGVR